MVESRVQTVLLTRTAGWEFFRYTFVGGLAFAADFGTMVLGCELLLKGRPWGVYVAVLLGFAAGLVTNYLLSLWFVFRDPEERLRGWTARAFFLFAAVGAAGVGLTELGMFVGCGLLRFNYVLVRLFTAGVVVAWNFLGRKFIVSWK